MVKNPHSEMLKLAGVKPVRFRRIKIIVRKINKVLLRLFVLSMFFVVPFPIWQGWLFNLDEGDD